MKKVLIVIALFLWVNILNLSAQNFSIFSIPPTLIKGVNSVVRDSKTTYSIKNGNKVSVHEYSAITVFNSKALHLAHLKIFYNASDKLKIISAVLYDAQGKKIRSIKRSEMDDYSMAGDATLYSDQRVVFSQVVPTSYPFTVEFEYEITYNQLYGIKTYSPYSDSYQSVEKSSLILEKPGDIPLNIKTINLPTAIDIQETVESTTWSFSELSPLIDETFSPDISEIRPEIRIAPELIVYGDYRGKADTWENYGSFLAQLRSEDKGLSPETIELLRQKTADLPTTRDKIKTLYKYMQSRTHYINISMDIGGIQPHAVSKVDELGYGDCKDLSSYMIAMLDAVDVEACYAVVKSGKGAHFFIPELPNHQFNHVIVCVPNNNDTLWLECTSQVMPFGHLGGFTDNRYALIVKDTGSKLVKTPEYTKKDNYIHSSFTLEKNTEGISALGSISYGGLLLDAMVALPFQNQTDQLSWIDQKLEIADFSLLSHEFTSTEVPEANVVLELELMLKSFFNGNGNRLFVPLNLNNKIEVPERMRSRKYPLELPFAFHTSDTLRIKIPSGYVSEQLPQSQANDERFGAYSMQTTQEADMIICIRNFELYKGKHDPEIYHDFYAFMQKASLADARQLVLIKQE